MGILQKFKKNVGKLLFRREKEIPRRRKGSNFKSATKVGLIYKEAGEERYRSVKQYVKHLHEEHGIRNVKAMCFIDGDEKDVPRYHAHKLEMDYFVSGEINWQLKPSIAVKDFVREEFDVLIDLSMDETLELAWVTRHSKARMKVGRAGVSNEAYYDMLIEVKGDTEQLLEQVDFYLSNFNIQ